ncbi:MAG: sulfur carrier protein ThiS [Prevotellaceae bacterium]|jgi:thiamine biosynthesis protein ThiS|nr:sulfur carrier protein ThiS [Prevotellaceae bacterium]
MTVKINAKEFEIEEQMTLLELVIRNGLPTDGIVMIIEDRIIGRGKWENIIAKDGMEIIMLQAVSGG